MNSGIKNIERPFIEYVLLSTAIFSVCAIPVLLEIELALFAILGIGIGSFILISNNFRLDYSNILYLIILLSILTPPVQISSSLPRVRFDEVLIYLIFPLILTFNLRNHQFDSSAKKFITIYSIFIGTVFISTAYGSFFLNVPVGSRDVFEIVTLFKYLLLFCTIYTFSIKVPVKNVLYFILFIIILSGVFGLMLFFGTLGFDTIFGELYLQDRVHIIDDRLVGTYKNPNTYSAILVFGHIIGLTLFLLETNLNRKPILVFALLIISMFILLAGSRTMIVGYLFATVLVFVFCSYKSSLSKKQLAFILSVLGLGIMVTVSFLSYEIMIRFQSGIDLLEDESLALRILAWYLNIQLFLQSPILGWGPAKDMITTIVDNEFILILRRYGIVGFIAFIGFYLYPLKLAFNRFREINSEPENIFNIVIICSISVFLLANMTNSLFHDFQVMDLWVSILAFYFVFNRNNTSINKAL